MAQPYDTARSANPAPLAESEIFAACREFVLAYAQPAMDPENVIQGWRNLVALPAGNGDFAVISIVCAVQRGTTVETFTADDPDPSVPGTLSLAGLMDIQVKVDCYADSDLARLRAQRLAVVACSSAGAAFFAERSLSALYAEEVKEPPKEDETGLPFRKYSIILHVCGWSGDSVEMDYFNAATLARLEDVDAHHPLHEE